ncbi:S8 family peptidase [Streptomyces sp. NPDC096354]|uniref:S8 family peptidase n=1 Tax=Streptomyces sp. NPDC096354 TaxID=3366088 RepID=UPI0037FFA5F2
MQYPSRERTRRRLLATAAVIAVTTSLPGLAGMAGAQAAPPATGIIQPRQQATTTTEVTLVTGDIVTLTTQADGKQSVTVQAAEGTDKTFQTLTEPNGDMYVFPSDAIDGVASQALDKRLFNVTQLIKDGYGDAQSDEMPVIVSYANKPAATTLGKRAAGLPASERGLVADKVGMAGVHVDKDGAKSFWKAVKPVSKASRKGKAVTVPGTAKVTKLWYDGKVKASLDKSVPQIGAPEAWAQGYDGKGTKVAILNTGAGLDNADIAPRITQAKSFIEGEDADDGYGHGTHVASTIAGSGVNSGGRYKGVAPGADLLIGKVLDNKGGGDFSDVLAGMEWAADQGADVVNMSLGTTANDSTDALTEAVDSLSAFSGTLFVIAAGNYGPEEISIASPATAASALTVGAVDRGDQLAPFSSRGPRIGDAGIKPEITAPGVGIVAARASGTTLGTPVDANYIAMNGTSMATPHVAGAAALMAQRHPDWNGACIKAALTSHAKTVSGQTVYEQGYGRVDVAAAVDSDLNLAGTVDYGLVKWQDGTFDKLTRTLTFSNDGPREAVLDLDAQVKDASGATLRGGALTFSGESVSGGKVTVPAGTSAEVTRPSTPTPSPRAVIRAPSRPQLPTAARSTPRSASSRRPRSGPSPSVSRTASVVSRAPWN